MSETTFQKVCEILNDRLGIIGDDQDGIKASDLLQEDLGADSLDAFELIYEVEEVFGIEIDTAKVAEIKTVGDLVDLIETLSGANA